MYCLLVGNYGVDNMGDEALKEYFLETFPFVSWQVLSARPREPELPRLPGGLRSFFRMSWIRTIRAYRASDGVVFGGGTLFTDIESTYACLLWFMHAALAFIFNKPVFLAFQGMGPWDTRLAEGLTRFVVRRAAFVSVRDDASFQRVKSWGVSREIVRTYDPIYSRIHALNSDSAQKVYIIIPRRNSGKTFLQRAKELQNQGSWDRTIILSLHPSDTDEAHTCRSLADELHIPPADIHPIHTLSDLQQFCLPGSFMLTQRFHGAVAAFAAGMQFEAMAQHQGDKLDEIAHMAGDSSKLAEIRTSIETGRESLVAALQSASKNLSRSQQSASSLE